MENHGCLAACCRVCSPNPSGDTGKSGAEIQCVYLNSVHSYKTTHRHGKITIFLVKYRFYPQEPDLPHSFPT